MRRFKRLLGIGLAVCLLALLSGCYALNSESFYSLPKRSEEYYVLEKAVQSAMGSAGYSAPVSGSNRQAIQQEDLDGDGQKETLVFGKAEGDKPLKMYILKRDGADYRLLCTVEGDGAAFDSVQYAQIDGEPGMEILLSRRVSEQVQQYMTVYSLQGESLAELLSTGCTAFTTADLDGDRLTDLFLLRANSDGPNAFAALYRWDQNAFTLTGESSLSTGAESLKRVITGETSQGVPAIFVASAYGENELITDVFALDGDTFRNISLSDESGQSTQTVRNYYVYSTDIDGDGLTEIPNTVPLDALDGDERSEGQYRIVWYNLALDGSRHEKLTTYHNYAEGWYLYLPEGWTEGLAVTQGRLRDGMSGTCLLQCAGDGAPKELLTVYEYVGEDAAAYAAGSGMLLLGQREETAFLALPGSSAEFDETELQTRFNLISADLIPGVN